MSTEIPHPLPQGGWEGVRQARATRDPIGTWEGSGSTNPFSDLLTVRDADQPAGKNQG